MTTLSKWQSRFIRLAEEVATWSKDPEASVGCVVISPDRRQISYGYNGLPASVPDTHEILSNVELKLQLSVHAELNAILNARTNLTGWHIYVTKCPCVNCAKAIIQAGLTEIVCPAPVRTSKWFDVNEAALSLLAQANVTVTLYSGDLL